MFFYLLAGAALLLKWPHAVTGLLLALLDLLSAVPCSTRSAPFPRSGLTESCSSSASASCSPSYGGGVERGMPLSAPPCSRVSVWWHSSACTARTCHASSQPAFPQR